MKIKFNKKIIRNYFAIFCGISLLGILPLTTISSLDNESISNVSRNLNANLNNSRVSNFALTNNNNNSTTPNKVIMPNVDSTGALDLEKSPAQYYAPDNIYFSGYALLTSSNETAGNYDQVTKFSSTSTTTGQAEWIVKKTDLGTLISVSDATKLKINSINFVLGDVLSNSPSSIMVLLNSTETGKSGTYLFKIIWDGADKGKYELVAKIGDANYNFMLSVNNSLSIYGFPKIVNTTTANVDIPYVNINNINKVTTPTISVKKIIVPPQVIKSYFGLESIPYSIFYLRNNIYIVYQAKISVSDLDSFFSIFQISQNNVSSSIDIAISETSIAKLNLETLFVGSQAIFNTTNSSYLSTFNFVDNTNNVLSLVLSQGSTTPGTTSGNYASININLNSLFSTSPIINISTHVYPPSTGYYFVNIERLYSNNSNESLGYVAIDSNNLAVELDLNFAYKRSLYNFESAKPTLGKIYNIYTKPLDQNWYAQMTDTTIAQMYSNSLIGQWDKVVASTSSLELPAIINVRASTEVLDGAIFTKIANSQNNGYSSEFTSLMRNETTYSKFLDVTFTDPKLGNKLPKIGITYSVFSSSNSNNYPIELTFTQTLRTLDASGTPTSGTTTPIVLAKSVFNFINGNGAIKASSSPTSGFEPPLFIKSLLPSAITSDIALEHLLRLENILNPKLVLRPNDLLGTLTIEVEIPYMWINNSLVTKNISSFEFGTNETPYFLSNPLSQQDVSVMLYNKEYLLENPEIKRELVIKYSGLLPTQITKNEVMTNFVKFGSAFSDVNNESYISKLTNNDINIVPLDATGELFVDFTFTKIGNKTNVRYSFVISEIFLSNPTANDSVYFVFKSNEEVLSTDIDGNPNTAETYREYRPSQLIPNLINSSNKTLQLQTLSNYASFSTYFSNILNVNSSNGLPLMTISTEIDDSSGLLTLIINLENPLPNSDTRVIRQTFTGFRKSGNVIGSQSSFSFNTMPQALLSRSATSITTEDLLLNNVLQISGQTNNLNKEIILVPVNESGSLTITVRFFNWVELSGGVTSIVPIKEFNRTYIGFPVTKPALNSLIWKSFFELDPSYKTLSANDFVNTIKEFGDSYGQIKIVANLSDNLDAYLKANPDSIEIQYIPNAENGSLTINASIAGLNGLNSVNTFSTIISGFTSKEGIVFVTWSENNNAAIEQLKSTKFPSQITTTDVGLFYSVSGAESFSKNVHRDYDDITGTLSITLNFKNNDQNLRFEKKYDGFQINKPIYKGTDIPLIAMLIGIPFAILLVPLIVILVIRFWIDKWKVVKKLNARLDEQRRNSRKIKKVKSAKDLIE
ncbi:MAG: lipoprotein 17-related variable surface protein [Malacoplasma sp.]